MSKNYQDLILKIIDMRNRLYESVLPYTAFFNKDRDARVTLFSKCINVLDSTKLCFIFYNFYLTEPTWWDKIPTILPLTSLWQMRIV